MRGERVSLRVRGTIEGERMLPEAFGVRGCH